MFGKCSECLQPCDSPGRPARQASSARHVRQPGHHWHWHWQPERSQARPEAPKDSPKPPGRGRPSTSKEKASVDKLLLHTRPGNPGTRRLTARLSAHMGPIRGHRQIVTEGSYLCPPATDGAHLWTPSVDRSFSLDPNTSRPTPLSPSPPPHPRRRTGLSKHSAQRPVLRLRPVSPSEQVGSWQLCLGAHLARLLSGCLPTSTWRHKGSTKTLRRSPRLQPVGVRETVARQWPGWPGRTPQGRQA